MTATEPGEPNRPRPEPLPHQLLCALAQHRMATTRQLHDLLRPTVALQTVSTPLNKLRHKGLIDYTVLPQSNRTRAWYLTGEGARLTRDIPALRGRPPYPINSATAASLKPPTPSPSYAPTWPSQQTPAGTDTNTAHGTGPPRCLTPWAKGNGSWLTPSCTTTSSMANTAANFARSWKWTAPP